MADRFRLTFLKSKGLGQTTFDESISFNDDRKITNSSSTLSEYNIPEPLSSEAIIKQAKTDLKHPDPKIRVFALKFYLEKFYPSIPISLLQEILSDRDPEVRAQALRSLIQFKSPILPPLLKKYFRDNDPRVRMATLRGMFQFEEKIDLNILLQFLSDESSWVRRKLATLLGWTQIEGALPILMEMSRDQDSMVRRAALLSLHTLYPDESESRLMEAMTDSDPDLRKWAKRTLEKIVVRPLTKKVISLRNPI